MRYLVKAVVLLPGIDPIDTGQMLSAGERLRVKETQCIVVLITDGTQEANFACTSHGVASHLANWI